MDFELRVAEGPFCPSFHLSDMELAAILSTPDQVGLHASFRAFGLYYTTLDPKSAMELAAIVRSWSECAASPELPFFRALWLKSKP